MAVPAAPRVIRYSFMTVALPLCSCMTVALQCMSFVSIVCCCTLTLPYFEPSADPHSGISLGAHALLQGNRMPFVVHAFLAAAAGLLAGAVALLRRNTSTPLPVVQPAPSYTWSMAGAAGVQDDKDAEEASGVEWAGEGVLSRIVNGLIKSPLYPVMKRGARDTLINSAEKNGVAWRQQVWALLAERQIGPGRQSSSTSKHHAYDQGILLVVGDRGLHSDVCDVSV